MYQQRFDRLAQALPEEADAAILTSEISRRYFTGLHTTAGIIVLTRTYRALIIDARYIERARRSADGFEVLLQERLGTQLTQLFARLGVKTVCMEESSVTLRQLRTYEELLPDVVILKDAGLSNTIDSLRRIKSPTELAHIQAAQQIADQSFNEILQYIRPGKTERQVALELELLTRRNGSEGASFDFIVVSGTNTSSPHGSPTDKLIEQGDLITMDFGCIVEGYHSDMTRTIGVGRVGDEERRIYETVLAAQLAALDAIRPGKTGQEIDRVARDVIEQAGYGAYFTHGLGHSLGLEIHEDPRFAPGYQESVPAGAVMSVEPGIYIEGRFGCRIEDIVFLGEDSILNLCTSPKELLIL